ncbi:MAG: diguanylate cyclase [Firmicutes bacterium]|jgi:diguanylate cyclase (GGDEF)-like protein|nr:diguanylate cyclase [Bacillota bacterium]
MRLRNKVLSILGPTILCLIVVLYVTSRIILLGGFARLEEREVRRNVGHALSTLSDRLSSLGNLVEDWALWDDTCRFIEDKNLAYIESNLGDLTFSNLGLSVMLYMDASGETVFGKGFDLSRNEAIPVPEGLREQVDRLATHGRAGKGVATSPSESVSGILLLPEGPMLVAASPILTSEGKGPVRGTLIMGRYLDSAVVRQLTESVHLPVSIERLGSPEAGPDLKRELASGLDPDSVHVRVLGTDLVEGSQVLEDLTGNPCLLLKVQVPRDIYNRGRASVLYFLAWLMAAGGVFGIVTIASLEKMVLSRLSVLSKGVNAIGATGDLSARVPATGHDEISDLSQEINRMLGALQTYQDQLRASEERYRHLSVTDSLTGLRNRTHFEEEMRRLEGQSHAPIGIILCDVDGLKLVNDTFGHDAGDQLLLAASRVFREALPGEGTVARIGGDEFAMLLPDTDRTATESVCRRLRDAIELYNAAHAELPLSASMGFAARNDDDASKSMASLFKEADDMMYREKLHRSRTTRSVIVQTLMKAIEARDFVTEGRLDRLENLVARVAKAIGLSEDNVADLRMLAKFHNIGKVGVPDRILAKPGSLTPEETEEMRLHCKIGLRIAQSVSDLVPISDWILKHHEWWNGQGYPLGLRGEEIPLECRILSIVDAYDAMTSDRPYRRALTHEQAVRELERCAGTQFDPSLVDRIVQILEADGSNPPGASSDPGPTPHDS